YRPSVGAGRGSIDIVWMLPDNQLANLYSVILAGQVPSEAVIRLPWLEVDSEIKWDNEESPSVPIEDVSLNFSLEGHPSRSETALLNHVINARYELAGKLSPIEVWLRRISWAVGVTAVLWGVVVIAVLLLLPLPSRYRHW